jgi:hypothetical protein
MLIYYQKQVSYQVSGEKPDALYLSIDILWNQFIQF